MRKFAMIAGLAAILACGQDARSPSAPAVEFVDVSPKHTEGGFEDHYSAGDTATIAAHNTSSGDTLPTNVISSAQVAVQRWNNRIFGLSGGSLPHLNPTVVEATSVSGTMIELKYTDECSGTGCGYCGDWYESGGVRGFNLNHKPLGGSCQDGRIVDDLTGVIMHELSHVLGFDHSSGSGTEWCVSNVTEEGDLNPYPCRWEEQAVYAAYDLRDSEPKPGVPIADEIVIPGDPDTVFTGSSSIVRAYGLVGPEPSENVEAGGDPGLPWMLPPDTVFVDVNWDDDGSQFFDATKVDTLGRATIDGIEVGQGTVYAVAADQANDSVATALPWPTADATIVVQSASGLNPCFQQESSNTWRHTDQYLTTGCGSTGSNIQYRWRFQDGGSWTSFSPDTLYEFFGHPSPDTYIVTMEVKDTSTGATEQSSHQFSVSSDLMSMSGPTYVTDKQLKTYQSNHAGKWYERWDPETSYDWNLTLGTYRNYSQYTRIWAAGDYTTLLRVERMASGLGRDRLEVVVCHESIPGCGGPPPMEWAMPGGDTADTTDLPLFGGGPWIASDSLLIRFYDLTGLYEPGSPFADIGWIDPRERGRAISGDGRVGLSWAVTDATADTRVVEFVVDEVVGAYTFGLALDPDVGKSPADDHSFYDPASGAVVAFDGTEALGFILLKNGSSDLHAVKQYGAHRFAPREAGALRQASRETVGSCRAFREPAGSNRFY